MTIEENYTIDTLVRRYPTLLTCQSSIEKAYAILHSCFEVGNKLLVAGNGGSCADADHIVGELMKSFCKKRPISDSLRSALYSIDHEKGAELAEKLEQGLPAIALHNHPALNTAFSNDVVSGADYFYAQQVLGYGKPGDVFLGISTSGNATNVVNAAIVAKAKGMKVIALTGKDGGKLKNAADVSIIVPLDNTFLIQELHLPIYHCLCLLLENAFFKD